MKILGLILVIGLLAFGCARATFNHSEMIDTDQQGYAGGRYASNSQGPTGAVTIGASGAGAAGGGAGGGGFGAVALSLETGPPKVTPYYFAKSIAMINYSRKLKSIKYDETGGIIEYEFERDPSAQRSSYRPVVGQTSLPSSFGHQPIE